MYVPGQEMVIDGKTYQSEGLYVPFPDNFHAPFRSELARGFDAWVCCNCTSALELLRKRRAQRGVRQCGGRL